MDLLCTENINNNENEIQPNQQLNEIFISRNNNNCFISKSSDSCSSTSSSLSSTSSGYNSSNSCSSFTATNSTKKYTETTKNTSNTITGIEFKQLNETEENLPIHYFQQQQQHRHCCSNKSNDCNNHIYNRSLDHVNTATEDPALLTDHCLEIALKAEEKRAQRIISYFKTIQKDVTPPMRKIVAEWMMEVCAEEKCQKEVVLLALIYMDRFLSIKSVRKTHLQILAAACLLLASKLREPSCRALSADLLVIYTDNSIYKSDLINWELYVLNRLSWDLSSVTPLDFLELLLIRIINVMKCDDISIDKVRQHAEAFISLAAKEHYFSAYSSSTIAAASIATALNGLNCNLHIEKNMRNLLNILTDLTSIEQDYLYDCMLKMEAVFEEHSRKLEPFLIPLELQSQQQQQQQHQQQQQQKQQHLNQQNLSQNMQTTHQQQKRLPPSIYGSSSIVDLPDLTQTCKMQANVQKDVQDIKF